MLKSLSFNNTTTVGAVYKFFDIEDNLLYIGKATNLRNRLENHKAYLSGEEWKDNIARITYIPEPNHCNLDILETYLINKLRPKYNRGKVFKHTCTYEIPYPEEIELEYEYLIKRPLGFSFYNVAKSFDEGTLPEKEAYELYPEIKILVEELGQSVLKANSYNISRLTAELDNFNRYKEFDIENRIRLLFTEGHIKPLVDNFYSSEDINCCLHRLYEQNSITYAVKASIVKKLFSNVKQTTKRVKGKPTAGYCISY